MADNRVTTKDGYASLYTPKTTTDYSGNGNYSFDSDYTISRNEKVELGNNEVETFDFDEPKQVEQEDENLKALQNQMDFYTMVLNHFVTEKDKMQDTYNLLPEGLTHRYNQAKGSLTSAAGYGPNVEMLQINMDNDRKELDELIKEKTNGEYTSYDAFYEDYQTTIAREKEINMTIDGLNHQKIVQRYYNTADEESYKNYAPNYKIVIGEETWYSKDIEHKEKVYNIYNQNGAKLSESDFTLSNTYDNIIATSKANDIQKHTDYILSLLPEEARQDINFDFDYSKMYFYLLENYGEQRANQYIDEIKDEMNCMTGLAQAAEFLEHLNANGSANIDELINIHFKGIGDGVVNSIEGLQAWLSENPEKTANYYEAIWITQFLATGKYGDIQGFNYELGQSIGNMLPSVVLSAANPTLGSVYLALSSGGNTYRQGRWNGEDVQTAMLKGLLSGASEVVTEKFLGSLPFLSEVKVTDAKSWLKSMIREGEQEVLQDLFNSYLLGEEYTVKDAIKTFIIAGLTSGEMNIPGIAYTKVFNDVYNIVDGKMKITTQAGDVEIDLDSISNYIEEHPGCSFEEAVNKYTLILNSLNNNKIENDTQITETANRENLVEAQEKLTDLIGEELSKWLPDEQSSYQLYTQLEAACKKANIKMTDLKNEFEILEKVEHYYSDAKNLKLEKGGKIFETYRTHGIIHVLDVLTQSINTFATFDAAGINDLSLRTISLAAIMHDTGMSGGKQIVLTNNENNDLIPSLKDVESKGKNYRESHSFNSGNNILLEYDLLNNYYTDTEIAEAAILTFAHSKSNSGLNPLSNNSTGWTFAINILADGSKGSGIDIIKVLKDEGIIIGQETGKRDIKVKCPDGSVRGKYETYTFDQDWMNKISHEALIIRLGDALTNNDNAKNNQYGGKITFDKTDYRYAHTIENISDHFNIDKTSNNKIVKELISTGRLTEAAIYESENTTFEVDGKEYKESQPFVLGEHNQTYRIEKNSNGDVEVIIKVRDSDSIPLSTIFAIDERAGEINSRGQKIFNKRDTSTPDIKLVIELDESTKTDVKDLYNQYAEFYNEKDGNDAEVVIRYLK